MRTRLSTIFLATHRIGIDVAKQDAILVVLVGGGDVQMARHARHGARRDARLGVLVTQIRLAVGVVHLAVAGRQNHLAAVDLRNLLEHGRIDRFIALAEKKIGNDQDRTLIAVGQDGTLVE